MALVMPSEFLDASLENCFFRLYEISQKLIVGRIMNKRQVFLLFSLLFLVACGQKEGPNSSEAESTTATTSIVTSSQGTNQSELTTESEASSSNPATSRTAHFNGSYYSVQGKYGEVIIVNKKHPLAASYAPGEDPDAQAAFGQLLAAMQAMGLDVSNQYSGFRSYETQANLYNSYVARDGQANADRYSARPGYSEHQTGLAFDLMDSSGNLLQEPGAVNWLAQHAHEYGFIVRYMEGKEAITGYMTETWHIRYIGQEATDIYKSGLSLEEYFGLAGGDYE
jgi:D-alanyl-D-alanine carboxypeptidase